MWKCFIVCGRLRTCAVWTIQLKSFLLLYVYFFKSLCLSVSLPVSVCACVGLVVQQCVSMLWIHRRSTNLAFWLINRLLVFSWSKQKKNPVSVVVRYIPYLTWSVFCHGPDLISHDEGQISYRACICCRWGCTSMNETEIPLNWSSLPLD